jgi:hypothetical protein
MLELAQVCVSNKPQLDFECVHPIVFILMYFIYWLPSTQQTIGYNWVYSDMFQLTRVIRLRSDTFECIEWLCAFWDPKKAYNIYQLLTYNHYLKVVWLCVSIAVSTLEYCPVLLLLLNVLLFLVSIGLLSVCALVPLRCVSDPVSDYLQAELLHWFCILSFCVIRGGTCFRVLLCCCVALVGLCLLF